MKSDYILNGHTFKLAEHFPKTNKVGIFLSGGMESTLISYIAIQLYGKENIKFFYSDNIFTCNNSKINSHVKTNIANAENTLGIRAEYISFDYSLHVHNRKLSIEQSIKNIEQKYSVECLLFGFTKLFFDVEIFKQQGMTIQDIKRITMANPEKYKSVIEEFHLKTNRYIENILAIDIPPEVYQILRDNSGFIKSPFRDLNKSEVVEFYNQLGLLGMLYNTTSCIESSITETGKHCGRCFNCQQRWDAFKILGTVDDLTPYESDNVKHYREEIEHL